MPSAATRPLWLGRSTDPPAALALELSATLEEDRPLAPYDVEASRAHVAELRRLGVIDARGEAPLAAALRQSADQIAAGTFSWQADHEDVHMNVEAAVR